MCGKEERMEGAHTVYQLPELASSRKRESLLVGLGKMGKAKNYRHATKGRARGMKNLSAVSLLTWQSVFSLSISPALQLKSSTTGYSSS